ncbi:RNA polymerase sigma factor [Nocardia wallacei]|uniref:RNA polymerase sigma factor n=1 Tax=Nocardia wallacei TaxID=480035 RepID=UPI0024574F7A|nr:RNA polymerase sigma factor [Nocardia wallacei]
MLIEVVASTHDMLLASVARQVGSRLDAEDIVQTALLRVYRARPDITEVDKLRSYLWAATANLVRDSWRRSADARRQHEPYCAERVGALFYSAEPNIDDMIALRHTVLAALRALPPREREALVLRLFHDKTYAEAARVMGISTGTVKGYVHNAFARVRARLAAALNAPPTPCADENPSR